MTSGAAISCLGVQSWENKGDLFGSPRDPQTMSPLMLRQIKEGSAEPQNCYLKTCLRAIEDEGLQVKHTAASGDYNTAPKTTQVLAEPGVSSKEQSLNSHDMYSAL